MSEKIMDRISEFDKYYEKNKEYLKKAAKTYKNLLMNLLNENLEKVDVVYRIKEKESCKEKIGRKYSKILEEDSTINSQDVLTDLIGVRIICMYESDIDKVAAIVENEFSIVDMTDKRQQIQELDNAFGYKGLHYDLKLDSKRSQLSEYKAYKDLPFELQIRTIIQNAWSELDHKIKYKKHIPKSLARRINRLAALFEIADTEFENIDNLSRKLQDKANEKIIETTSPGPKKAPLKAEEKQTDTVEEVLNIFDFVALLQEHFEDVYQSWAVETLLDDILDCDEELFFSKAYKILEKNLPIIEQYLNEHPEVNPSILTMIRYAFYIEDKNVFRELLYDDLRMKLDSWLKVLDQKKKDK